MSLHDQYGKRRGTELAIKEASRILGYTVPARILQRWQVDLRAHHPAQSYTTAAALPSNPDVAIANTPESKLDESMSVERLRYHYFNVLRSAGTNPEVAYQTMKLHLPFITAREALFTNHSSGGTLATDDGTFSYEHFVINSARETADATWDEKNGVFKLQSNQTYGMCSAANRPKYMTPAVEEAFERHETVFKFIIADDNSPYVPIPRTAPALLACNTIGLIDGLFPSQEDRESRIAELEQFHQDALGS